MISLDRRCMAMHTKCLMEIWMNGVIFNKVATYTRVRENALFNQQLVTIISPKKICSKDV